MTQNLSIKCKQKLSCKSTYRTKVVRVERRKSATDIRIIPIGRYNRRIQTKYLIYYSKTKTYQTVSYKFIRFWYCRAVLVVSRTMDHGPHLGEVCKYSQGLGSRVVLLGLHHFVHFLYLFLHLLFLLLLSQMQLYFCFFLFFHS